MNAAYPSVAPEPVHPDYDGAWIGGIVAALLGDADRSWLPATVNDNDSVVLLVVDGLGWELFNRFSVTCADLRALAGGPITTCAPATTSAALTSITTGLPPGQHGIVGYRTLTAWGVLDVLGWSLPDGSQPAAGDIQPHVPFGGRRPAVVTRTDFRNSGFTNAHLRGSRFFGYETPAVMVEQCRQLVLGGETFVYAYYDGLDKVAHAHGIDSDFCHAEAKAVSHLVGALLEVLPTSCTLLVTADHGHVQLDVDGKRELNEVAGLCADYSGDARCRFLHALPGNQAQLLEQAQRSYGHEAWIFSREQFIDEGWLGPSVANHVIERVGDVIIAAHAPVTYPIPKVASERRLRAHHGSFTADEMLVPLVAAPGNATW